MEKWRGGHGLAIQARQLWQITSLQSKSPEKLGNQEDSKRDSEWVNG